MAQPPVPGRDAGAEPGRDRGLPGGVPGVPGRGGERVPPARGRDERLAAFAGGGAGDRFAPGGWLAMMLDELSGPGRRCPAATDDELIGVLGRWQALESWAAAAKLGVAAELIRRRARPGHENRAGGDMPTAWEEGLGHELALALALSVPGADKLAALAWALAARLPGIAAKLAEGVIDALKAQIICEALSVLDDTLAARAEALIVGELAGKTPGQAGRLAEDAVLAVDPEGAQKRREQAERENARVRFWRERAGTAALAGFGLPTDAALAADANIKTRARAYKQARLDATMDQLRVLAYLDILNGISASARIAQAQATDQAQAAARARAGAQAPPRAGQPAGGRGEDAAGGGPGNNSAPAGGPGHHDTPGTNDPAGGRPADQGFDSGSPAGDRPAGEDVSSGRPAHDRPPHDGPGNQGATSGGPGDDGPAYEWLTDNGSWEDGCWEGGDDHCTADNTADSATPDSTQDGEPAVPAGPGGARAGHGPGGPGAPPGAAPDADPGPALEASTNLTIPLATLQRLADRPGAAHGLGPLDPALARDLAAAAARSPHSTWCITITSPDGYAIGHGCARLSRRHRAKAPPPGGRASPWSFEKTSDPGPPGGYGTWTLTLPGGRDLTVKLGPIPVTDCDHRHESRGYQPSDTLRHLVQVRDGQCTFPACSRHARDSDFEHALPYDQGGRTCGCNAGARSRRCHRVKQSNGWTVTQPLPGWHQWRTPSGRSYTQGPMKYPS